MFSCEKDAPLWRNNMLIEERLLSGMERGKGPTGIRVILPDFGCTHFELS